MIVVRTVHGFHELKGATDAIDQGDGVLRVIKKGQDEVGLGTTVAVFNGWIAWGHSKEEIVATEEPPTNVPTEEPPTKVKLRD